MITQQISPTVESIARGAASVIVNLAGSLADIDSTCSRVRDEFVNAAKKDPQSAANFRLVADRTEQILRGYHAALEANDTEAILGRFFDLMPQDIQNKIQAGAAQVLTDCGVDVECFKDEEGTTFLRVNGIEKLGVPEDEIERMNALARPLPTPVGELRRVH